jgi:hypothetical protein
MAQRANPSYLDMIVELRRVLIDRPGAQATA